MCAGWAALAPERRHGRFVWRRAGLPAFLVVLVLGSGGAHAQDLADVSRELTDVEGEVSQLVREQVQASRLRSPTFVEERLTDGELFYRLQDYVRASIIFTDIVDNYPNHRAYPDALFLLADSLFRAGDFLGARKHFAAVLDQSNRPTFRPYLQRALGRLIEIAIHTRDFRGVDGYFQQLSRLPPQEIEAATTYFRAKYLYNVAVPTEEVVREGVTNGGGTSAAVDLARLDRARESFQAVQAGSPYYPQARYFIGVIHTLRGEYPQAIEAFRLVLRAEATTPEHRQVVELTQLALGRLYYETDQLDQAIEAYQAVPRTSKAFDTALYEVSWAFIRLGDSTRAERALEVLAVAEPDSRHIPDGKILRGNLLLRNGRFDDATTVFREVRNQFGPVHRSLRAMIEEHDDPEAYFRSLVRDNLESFDANAFLPEEARRWVDLNNEMERALGTLSDLSQARRLVTETSDLIERLNGALSASNPVNVFADLRRHRERTTAARNRVAQLREQLMRIEERRMPSGGGELASVRAERRQIERMLGGMPTGTEDFIVRDDQLLGRYNALERQLSALEVELMGMEARVVATERFLADTEAQNEASTVGMEATLNELRAQKAGVEQYRERIKQLERVVEIARLQVGVGDARYARDERLRGEYNALVERERQLLAASGIPRPEGVDRLFDRMTRVESTLDAHDARIDGVVEERVAEMRVVIQDEAGKLDGYRSQLVALEDETEVVVGGVTYANFDHIRDRFYNLVLRADVGRIDVAWARREEHRMRVDLLTRERARELQALDDEFREIQDDGGGEEGL